MSDTAEPGNRPAAEHGDEAPDGPAVADRTTIMKAPVRGPREERLTKLLAVPVPNAREERQTQLLAPIHAPRQTAPTVPHRPSVFPEAVPQPRVGQSLPPPHPGSMSPPRFSPAVSLPAPPRLPRESLPPPYAGSLVPPAFAAPARPPGLGESLAPPRAAVDAGSPSARGTSPIVWGLAAMGLLAVVAGLLGTGAVLGVVAFNGAAGDPPRAVQSSQVPQSIVDGLRERRLLPANEVVVAYYDATTKLDMVEFAFLTPERVVYVRDSAVSAIPLAEVTRVALHNEPPVGDVLDIATEDGRSMRVAVARLNGGGACADVLEGAWRKHHPDARIERDMP